MGNCFRSPKNVLATYDPEEIELSNIKKKSIFDFFKKPFYYIKIKTEDIP